MTKLQVFDPPMCCSSGVCGLQMDPFPPRFAVFPLLAGLRLELRACEQFSERKPCVSFFLDCGTRRQKDLARAGIPSICMVINQRFNAESFNDPVLVERSRREIPFIGEVRGQLASRLAVIPWAIAPPVGVTQLRNLAADK